jgi:ribonuclease HI
LGWLEVKTMKAKQKANKHVCRFYADGAGAKPDGNGSGIAWINAISGEKRVERIPNLTNNEAEYRAVISVLKVVPKGSAIEIRIDSLLVVSQLRGEYRILDHKLEKLASEVKTLVEQKQLTLTLTWVPRNENRAGMLL